MGAASNGVTVENANDTGILVDQASVTIQNDTVENNGVNPNPKIGSFGGIVLTGATNSVVNADTVTNNGGGASSSTTMVR